MDTQRREGIEIGRIEEREKTAIGLFKEEVDIEIISKVTGLSEDELLKLFRRERLV